MRVETVLGDITTQDVDAVVNAANSALMGGGGVDGAIHRAAGPELLAECMELRRTELPDGLPVGEAVPTAGYRLPARWIIHTVGPNAHRGETDPALLVAAFRSALRVAREVGARRVAVPAVSAGVYGWEPARVAAAARQAVEDVTQAAVPNEIELVRFVLAGEAVLRAFRAEFGEG